MRMTRGWTGLRLAAIALGLLAWNNPRAQADATTGTASNLLEYSVAGQIDKSGITGSNVISYVPVQNAMIDPTSNLPLGAFQVAPLPVGQTTTYNNTPFSLTIDPTGFNGTTLNQTPLTVTGELNGTVNGPYQSSVQVTFDPITQGSFALAGGTSTLSVLQNDHHLLVPSSAGGITTVEGQLASTGLSPDAAPVPEPSTIALFLSTVGGLGLRRYVMTRRQRVAA